MTNDIGLKENRRGKRKWKKNRRMVDRETVGQNVSGRKWKQELLGLLNKTQFLDWIFSTEIGLLLAINSDFK